MTKASVPKQGPSRPDDDAKAPRRFSSRQRMVLRLVAFNRCRICGAKLTRSFHADHIKPWSRGGETETGNGQALCARCNLKKGANDAALS